MSSVVPHRFLFRYRLPIRHVPRLPKRGRRLLNLPDECALPDFSELDDAAVIGRLRLAWNAKGVGIAVRVDGKKMPLNSSADTPADSDGLQIWIDTRDTQTIHRASRFCHHFCLLPAGAGRRGDQPVVVQQPIPRASDNAPVTLSSALPVKADVSASAYELEAWIPAEALNGYDPEANPRLGFYYFLRDAELGEQYLSVGPEFPFATDPSLWATLELVR